MYLCCFVNIIKFKKKIKWIIVFLYVCIVCVWFIYMYYVVCNENRVIKIKHKYISIMKYAKFLFQG